MKHAIDTAPVHLLQGVKNAFRNKLMKKNEGVADTYNTLSRSWTWLAVQNCITWWLYRCNFDGSSWSQMHKWTNARRDWFPQLLIPIAWWWVRLRTIENQEFSIPWRILRCVRINDCFRRLKSWMEPEYAQACCSSRPNPHLCSLNKRQIRAGGRIWW